MTRAGRPEQYVYGLHAVAELVRRDPLGVLSVWVQQDRHDERLETLRTQLQEHGLNPQGASRRALDRMTRSASHQGVVARYRPTARPRDADLPALLEAGDRPVFVLVLDQVVDPRNLGACLRTAAAAGVDAVVVPRHRSAPLTAAARKVASGAADLVPLITVGNLASALATMRAAGVNVVGAAGDAAKALYETDLSGPVALVLGGEERGLRRLTREACDDLVRIPMANGVQSLNVSAAAAVFVFEARRQRDALPPC